MQGLKAHQRPLVAAALITLLGFVLPGLSWVLLPLQYLNTHAHEFFHAVAALASGGHVSDIRVMSSGGGVTHISGGLMLLVGSAGYVGAAILGGVMLVASRSQKSARTLLFTLAVFLALSMVLWVRGDTVGVVSGLVWVLLLGYGASRLNGDVVCLAAAFLGLQQCLQAVQSLLVLYKVSAYPGILSDAVIAESATGVPAVLWSLLWMGFSFAMIFICARRAWEGK